VTPPGPPLRSLLFAPGNEPRKIEEVASFGADAVILDLEDTVPDADKVATRAAVSAALPDLLGCTDYPIADRAGRIIRMAEALAAKDAAG
jgi:HpcH/HpaI aldolase/citrate lyase family protein